MFAFHVKISDRNPPPKFVKSSCLKTHFTLHFLLSSTSAQLSSFSFGTHIQMAHAPHCLYAWPVLWWVYSLCYQTHSMMDTDIGEFNAGWFFFFQYIWICFSTNYWISIQTCIPHHMWVLCNSLNWRVHLNRVIPKIPPNSTCCRNGCICSHFQYLGYTYEDVVNYYTPLLVKIKNKNTVVQYPLYLIVNGSLV